MAPRQSSKRSREAPRSAKRRPPARTRPEWAAADSAEVKRSRRAALLQLKMGRLAHVIGIASALSLALTAVIAYLLENWEFLTDAPEYLTVLKWIIPLVAAVTVAVVGLLVKWTPYVADHDEPHFIMSVVAVAVPLFFIILIWMDELGYVAVGRPDWLYPASLLGFTLTELSFAMTWEGTSRRKTVSIVAAVLPPLILLFPIFLYFPPTELASILPMAYLGSAVAIQLSGSMLHIIASSTSVQEREVLKASDSKLRAQLQEIDNKRKALYYREDALRTREADLEAYEKTLSQELAAIEDRKTQVSETEVDMEQRMQHVLETKDKLRHQESELEGKTESLRLRQADIVSQQKELESLAESLTEKEEKINSLELYANQLMLEAKAKERSVENELIEVRAEQAALQSRRKELDEFEKELDEAEKTISSRQAALEMREMEISSTREELGKVSVEKTHLRDYEQQIVSMQGSLSEKERGLRRQEEEARAKMEKAERFATRVDSQMKVLVGKENELLAREKSLADNETKLRSELEVLRAKLEEAERARLSVEEKEKHYLGLSEETRAKANALSAQDDELSRKTSALGRREQMVKELESRIAREREDLADKLRTLIEKEKQLKAKEAEVNLRAAEFKSRERELLESVEQVEAARHALPEEMTEQMKVLDLREKRLREKEQEIKTRFYQREKDLEDREHLLQATLKKDIEEMGEEVEQEYVEEKVKSGVERLDDLLLGGLPFGSNVTYVGPPFIGKEVAVLLFAAEGLRKGVPVIVVTTSHPPSEIAREIAPILPSFMEFNQIGLVRWVDACGLPEDATNGFSRGDNVVRVSGPGDLEGILEAVDRFSEEFEHREYPYFRLAYLSLSVSLTNAPEKSGFQFAQALTSKVKQEDGIALYAVERGMHTEQQLETIQHQMTGAVQFKSEKQKTLLSVQGVGDVQSRDWIEYKHTKKAIMIGAFSLERIR